MMQDFNRYDYTLTLDQLRDLSAEYDGEITIVVNGEYYELMRELRRKVES